MCATGVKVPKGRATAPSLAIARRKSAMYCAVNQADHTRLHRLHVVPILRYVEEEIFAIPRLDQLLTLILTMCESIIPASMAYRDWVPSGQPSFLTNVWVSVDQQARARPPIIIPQGFHINTAFGSRQDNVRTKCPDLFCNLLCALLQLSVRHLFRVLINIGNFGVEAPLCHCSKLMLVFF